MQRVSSITMTAPEPSIEPALAMRVVVHVQSIMIVAGSTGTDEPPGITAFSLRPAAHAAGHLEQLGERRAQRNLVVAGPLDVADTEKILVPPLFGLPMSRNASPPLRMIHGTAAKVSVLLIVVGLPYRPKLAGNGGLKRGWPFLPSSDSSSAVSSPQM